MESGKSTGAFAVRALVGLLTVALAGCAGGPEPEPSPMPEAGGEDPTFQGTGGEPDLARLEALYEARTDSARMTVSEADVRFMTGMISHHAQALVMSDMATTHGASPEMLILTRRIINAQRDEIATMQGWLRDRGRHVPEVQIDGLELRIDGEEPMRMHGMLTDAQLRELDAARGTEWDRLFLEYMIMHHRGAVTMVHELFATDGAAQDDVTFKLASDIQVDQRTEIHRMELMLEEISGGPDGSASSDATDGADDGADGRGSIG